MNNKEYSLIRRLFSEQIEVFGYSHKELMETVYKLVEEKEKFFGKDNVIHDFKKRIKTVDENGKEVYKDTYRFTYFVLWISDLKQREAEIKNKEYRDITLKDVIEVINSRNPDPEDDLDR